MTDNTETDNGEGLAPELNSERVAKYQRLIQCLATFEAQWRDGRRPRIEALLGDALDSERSDLLAELLTLEVELRTRGGESPTPEEYWDRFPDDGEIVALIFGVANRGRDPNRDRTPVGSADSTQTILPAVSSAAPPTQVTRGGGAPANATPNIVTRYRLLHPFEKGGLGVVSVAYDEELRREVAVKQIQDRHARDPEHRLRFLMEAEVTAKLDHPGVVPIYGQGAYADGRLFYAMRLIPGTTLRVAISSFHKADKAALSHPSARSLALRQLLTRFVSICETIEYAHNRGVLHRDLKPDNVMLGHYGEVLVVDWGLAKLLDASATPPPPGSSKLHLGSNAFTDTQAGQILGTPRYMSPEQAAGDSDRVTTRSDIYSLGAILYCLLTGQDSILESDRDAVLQKVQKGDFLEPRKVNRAISPALEAVCLKAMALRPEDRYESARALANDIERWLADEPVSVQSEPLAARWGRWLRRHRTLVAAALVLLATATTALAIGFVLISREHQQVINASAEADSNLQLARNDVNHTLRFVSDGPLATLPQSEGIRERLAVSALGMNRTFLEKRPDDPIVQLDLAAALRVLGNVRRQQGQIDSALDSYHEAIAIGERLRREFPENETHSRLLISLNLDLGEAFRMEGRVREAQPIYEACWALAKNDLDRIPSQYAAQRAAAWARFGLAANLGAAGRLDRAHAAFQDVLTWYEAQSANPARSTSDLELALVLCSSAQTLRERNDNANALRFLQRSLDRVSRLLPLDNNAHYVQAYCRLEMGKALPQGSQESIQAMTEAIADFEMLSRNFPGTRDYRLMAALSRLGLAEIHRSRGDESLALTESTSACEVLEKLARTFPNNPAYQGYLGQALTLRGWLLIKSGREEAGVLLNQARSRLAIALQANEGAVRENQDMTTCERLLKDLETMRGP